LIRILVRKNLEIEHPKLQQEIVNFNDIRDYENKLGNGDCIFCCVGTTQKKVHGNKDAYRKVDFSIPLNAAKLGISKGFKKYFLVSAIGANAHSNNFYLKLKGETEDAIKEFNYESLGIFQPSILLGARNEKRSGEAIMKKLMKLFSLFLIGSIKKYRAINAVDVAKAMIEESKKPKSGVYYFTYEEMEDLANN
jgi:uncharacterized protein YbjT (DUF2867 family)